MPAAANKIGTEIFLTIHELREEEDEQKRIVRWKALLILASPSEISNEEDCLFIGVTRDQTYRRRDDKTNLTLWPRIVYHKTDLTLRPRIGYYNYEFLKTRGHLTTRISLAKLTSGARLEDYRTPILQVQDKILRAPKSMVDFEYTFLFWAEAVAEALQSAESLRFEIGFQALKVPESAQDISDALKAVAGTEPTLNYFRDPRSDKEESSLWHSWRFQKERHSSKEPNLRPLVNVEYSYMPVYSM